MTRIPVLGLALLLLALSTSPALALDQGSVVTPITRGDLDAARAQEPTRESPRDAGQTAGFEALPEAGVENGELSSVLQGAVGPNRLLLASNARVRVQSKNGDILFTGALAGWWRAGIPVERVSDPKILYDSLNGRWIFLALADRKDALLAVSADSDPLGAWRMWRFQGDPSGELELDAPGLGLSANWIAFSARQTDPSAPKKRGVVLWAVDRSEAYSGAVAPGTTRFREATFAGILIPAFGQDEREPVLSLICAPKPGELKLYALTGEADAPVWSEGPRIPVAPWAETFPKAPQRGSSARLNVGDARVVNAALRDGALWCAQSVALPSNKPTRVAVRWSKIDPTSGTLLQQGTLDEHASAGRFFFAPSIAVNASGQALLSFLGVSRTTYLSAYCARLGDASAPPFSGASLLKAGKTVSLSPSSAAGAVSVDPEDALSFWTLQEYASGQTRAAWWSKISTQRATVALYWRNLANGRNAVELYDKLTRLAVAPLPRVVNAAWRVAAVGPYDAQGLGRIFWRNPSSGKNSLQTLQGVGHLGYTPLRDVANSNWRLAGAADFNGNGALSLLWRNKQDGRLALEHLDENQQHLSYHMLDHSPGKEWRPADLADLNADGRPDILWRNANDGRNMVWFMRGASYLDSAPLPELPDHDWRLAGAADFNADGKPDLLWNNAETGAVLVWLMDGITLLESQALNPAPTPDWRAVGAANLRE